MDKLYPIVRRVRRPLLPTEETRSVPQQRDGTRNPDQSLVTSTAVEKEVSGETTETTAEARVIPEAKE